MCLIELMIFRDTRLVSVEYKGLIMKGYKLFTHTVVPLTRFADEMHTPYNGPSSTPSVN